MTYLFSYGTLQQEDVQIATFGRTLRGETDALPGYTRRNVTITDPDIVRKSGASVHPIVVTSTDAADRVPGTVFAVTEADLLAADAYEVSDYQRVSVRLQSGRDAWVYVSGASIRAMGPDPGADQTPRPTG
jgi:gamma-glutamylcyclotransferase (GGCT)/AIG2-like uncharacterized protein YtfP